LFQLARKIFPSFFITEISKLFVVGYSGSKDDCKYRHVRQGILR